MKDATAKAKRDACPKHGTSGYWLSSCHTPKACLQAERAERRKDTEEPFKGAPVPPPPVDMPRAWCDLCKRNVFLKDDGKTLGAHYSATGEICHGAATWMASGEEVINLNETLAWIDRLPEAGSDLQAYKRGEREAIASIRNDLARLDRCRQAAARDAAAAWSPGEIAEAKRFHEMVK